MPLPKSRKDREYQKFVDDGAGNTAVRAVVIGGGWNGGTVTNPTTFQSTVGFTDTATFNGQVSVIGNLGWTLADGFKTNNGTITAEGLEYTVQEIDEFAQVVGLSVYEDKSGQAKESHNDGALTYEFSRNSLGHEEKVVGVTALGIVHTVYNENQSGNAVNDVIFGQEFKSNAIIGVVVTETVFGKLVAKIKTVLDLPSIVYTLLGVGNDPYLEIDDVSHKIYKPLYTSSGTADLITNLDVPLARTVTLTFDVDTVIDTMLQAGSSALGAETKLIIPSGITITNRAGNISNNLQFFLDGNADLVTIGITILTVKCMGDKWLQTSPVSVVS